MKKARIEEKGKLFNKKEVIKMQKNKKGQLTLFIIIAIVIVALVILSFFFLRSRTVLPSKLMPVENYFRECIDLKVKEATKIAGLQGGYLELPDFEAGSSYMPFSNQLNFLGISIPYWFYISSNNLVKEQKPGLEIIEKQFSNYLKEKIKECDFSSLESQGYFVNFSGEPEVKVNIKTSTIETTVLWPLQASYETTTTTITEHKVVSKSNFGLLYKDAVNIYNFEQKTLFLENYSLDALRLYAPVDGIELSCAPKIWQKNQVEKELKEAIEGNIASIKIKGSSYDLAKPENKYFEVNPDERINSNSYFLFMPSWPTRFEVWPSENDLMIANPVGTQPGLEILSLVGLCYVPYHFVYDFYFPVIIQLTKGDELFQFPLVVVIDKNAARNATTTETTELIFDICQYKNQEAEIYSYDENSKAIEAEIYFKCFNQVCPLGKTKLEESKAKLKTTLPRCYNAFIIAKAPGYRDSKLMFSTIEPFIANIFLAPIHELTIEMPIQSGEYALITFDSESYSTTVYYPEQKKINLSEGNYNVSVYLFKESMIKLQTESTEKCIKVPVSGIGAIFGQTEEKCYDVSLPQQSLTNVLFGGGKTQLALTETELKGKNKIVINAETFKVPASLTDLVDIYNLIDISQVSVQLK